MAQKGEVITGDFTFSGAATETVPNGEVWKFTQISFEDTGNDLPTNASSTVGVVQNDGNNITPIANNPHHSVAVGGPKYARGGDFSDTGGGNQQLVVDGSSFNLYVTEGNSGTFRCRYEAVRITDQVTSGVVPVADEEGYNTISFPSNKYRIVTLGKAGGSGTDKYADNDDLEAGFYDGSNNLTLLAPPDGGQLLIGGITHHYTINSNEDLAIRTFSTPGTVYYCAVEVE
jgi:hypothetical protein